jgi:hypothetical protein
MDAQCKQVNNFEKIIDEIKITGCDFYFGETLKSLVWLKVAFSQRCPNNLDNF